MYFWSKVYYEKWFLEFRFFSFFHSSKFLFPQTNPTIIPSILFPTTKKVSQNEKQSNKQKSLKKQKQSSRPVSIFCKANWQISIISSPFKKRKKNLKKSALQSSIRNQKIHKVCNHRLQPWITNLCYEK